MHVSLRRAALGTALLIAALLAGLAAYRYGVPPRYAGPLSPPPNPPAPAELALKVFDPARPLPAVRFADAGGRERTLREFRGRVVLLDIWATWCAPCRKEMPSLDRVESTLGAADFVVLPVSIDRTGMAAVAPFYRALGIRNLAPYLDPLGRGTSALTIPGVPTTLLVDRSGRMVARKVGGAEWNSPPMVALIRRYLPGAAAAADRR